LISGLTVLEDAIPDVRVYQTELMCVGGMQVKAVRATTGPKVTTRRVPS